MPVMVMAAMMVQQLDRRADHEAMDLGDPLRGRALRSNRAARDFHCNPCRLRALRALRTPFARRLAALTAAPVSCSRSAHRSPRLALLPPVLPPVPASPRTGLRTTPGTGARTSADTSASAFGSVLRTTACGSARNAPHSIAVAAPLRRLRRSRFPLRSPSDSRLFLRPAACGSHTGTQLAAGCAKRAHVVHSHASSTT